MGNCAELCVSEYKVSREEQDAYSLESYRRAREATEKGLFAEEIVPVKIPGKKGETVVDRDEEPFKVDLDRLTTLRPAFQKDGTVTAGNASKINDGAAALVLTTASHAAELGVKPIARILAHSSLAQQPEWFTTAPVGAARAVLERAGLKAADIDLWEINEAFAAVALVFSRELGLDPERVNVRGGAVALGHPIGSSGARILVTLIHALRERGLRLGCAAICIGGGEATAMVIERID
jgi:acetyl-CoA C-acetyltransferase